MALASSPLEMMAPSSFCSIVWVVGYGAGLLSTYASRLGTPRYCCQREYTPAPELVTYTSIGPLPPPAPGIWFHLVYVPDQMPARSAMVRLLIFAEGVAFLARENENYG